MIKICEYYSEFRREGSIKCNLKHYQGLENTLPSMDCPDNSECERYVKYMKMLERVKVMMK